MSEKRFKDKAGENIYSWVKTNIGREKTKDKEKRPKTKTTWKAYLKSGWEIPER